MSLSFVNPRRALGFALIAGAAGMAACADSTPAPVQPVVTEESNVPPSLRNSAFAFRVNRAKGTVDVIAPTGGASNAPSLSADLNARLGGGKNYSILAGDVVRLETRNLVATDIGQETGPNRVVVSFEVRVVNRLNGARLITPTFPAAPAGLSATQQVLAFPFAQSTIVTNGSTTTVGDGTEVLVEQPSRGDVIPVQSGLEGRGPDRGFDGAPHNFFDDTLSNSCAVANPNCFLYEAYDRIEASQASAWRTVAFSIDPRVNQFVSRILIAADLENAAVTQATVNATVNYATPSDSLVIENAFPAGTGISVTAGGASQNTTARSALVGPFTVTGAISVGVGSALPAGCSVAPVSIPGPNSPGNTVALTASLVVSGCTVPQQNITFTVVEQRPRVGAPVGPTIALAGVSVDPSTGSPASATTDASGNATFSMPSLPAALLSGTASATLTAAQLTRCDAPAAAAYTAPTAVTITVRCDAPPPPPDTLAFAARSTRVAGTAGAIGEEFDLAVWVDPTATTWLAPALPNTNLANIQVRWNFGAAFEAVADAGAATDPAGAFAILNPVFTGGSYNTATAGQITSASNTLAAPFATTGAFAHRVRIRRIAAGSANVTVTVTTLTLSATPLPVQIVTRVPSNGRTIDASITGIRQ